MLKKKIWIFVIILIFLINTAQASDWPMFGHDLLHTGTTDEVVEPPLELLWKFQAGGFTSSPAVSSDTVYIGSMDSNVYALDATSGNVRWKYKTGDKVKSSPTISDSTVFIGSLDKYFYALDAVSGALKWKYQTGYVYSSPVVSGGIVYVGGGTMNSYFYALDATTGEIKWKYSLGSGIVFSSPIVSNGIVYFGTQENQRLSPTDVKVTGGSLYALDAGSGTLKWKYTSEGSISSSPSVSNGMIYFGSVDKYVYALEAISGKIKWKYQTDGGVYSSPAVSGGIVYFGSDGGYIYGLDEITGELLWKYRTSGYVRSIPAISGNILYVGSTDNYFYAIDKISGGLIWKYKTGSIETSSPAISDDMVYVGSADGDAFGYVYAFKSSKSPSINKAGTPVANHGVSSSKRIDDWPVFGHDSAHTGTTDEIVEPPLELLWKFQADGFTTSSPAVSGGTVYIGSDEGYVYALDTLNGSLKWKYKTGKTVSSSPAVVNGTVFIGSTDHNFYALDAISGSLKWKSQTGPVVSSPTVVADLVYVGSRREKDEDSTEGNFYALDTTTGEIRWKYYLGNGEVWSSPAVINGIVYFSIRENLGKTNGIYGEVWDGYIYALNASNGNLKWKYQTDDGFLHSSPAVSNGSVFVGVYGPRVVSPGSWTQIHQVYALDANNGNVKWKFNTTGTVAFSSPVVSRGVVYVSSSEYVYALEESSGDLRWKYREFGLGLRNSIPAISGNTLYISSSASQYLFALDISTGGMKWKYQTDYPGGTASPAVSDGVIFMGSDRILYAFKPVKSSSSDVVAAVTTVDLGLTPTNSQNTPKTSQTEPNASDSNNILYWILLAGIIVYAGQYFLKSKSSSSPAKNKALELKQSQEIASRSFEEGFNLSQEASAFFARKNFKRALESYNKALTKFESAQNSPHIDASLSTSIKNNKTSVQSNIVSCKLALGSSASEQGKTSLDKGDLNNAIKSYNTAKSYFEEALQDASVIKDEEKLKNAKDLLSQTITNIENCYINIDRRQVEELSESAELMLKEAEEHRNGKELSKARDVLKNAENNIEEAFDIATKRGFNEAQRILSTLLKNVRAEKNVVDSLFMTPIEKIKTDHRVSDVLALEPEIKVAKNINDLQVLRGYSVLSNNDLKFGIRLINSTNFVITDADVILDYTKDLFSMKASEIQHLGNITPNGKRTATYILKPLGCIHKENIGATVIYKDHTGNKQTLHMRPKEVHCVCPFLKEKPMSEGEYSRLAASSEFVQEGISFKGITVDDLAKFMGETCRHMLHKVREYNIEGKNVIYLSGESIGEKAYYLLTAVIQDYKGLTQVVLRAHSDKKYGLNGFMNEMADSLRHLVGSVQNAKEIGIIENTQVNIRDSVVQRRKIGKEG
ncbi:MAG: PQQ-binding-like beta-propeller repeat protein [Euryarchaeota archaeon]|nr:PQQ-binding-like beta-propeller repeat protein [Euryarchaeota archaeon]MCG2734835.1 PQQ-binding-like beta-propeller repeat protein [Candidatus Methanoperedenaceae archaeon]